MPRRAAPRLAILAALGLSLLPQTAPGAAPGPPSARDSERLRRLLEQAWDSKLRDRPEFATYIGFPGHNHLWTDLSPAGIERRRSNAREQLQAARAIDRKALPADEQVDLDLYTRRLESQVDGFRFPEDEVTITQYGGIQQDVPYALSIAPAAANRDYEDLLARLRSLPALVDQNIALLEQGHAAGVTPPKIQMQGVPDQVRALVPDDPWKSPLLARFRQISPNLEDDDATRIRGAGLHAYEERAALALRKLLQYLTATYIPATRDSIGMDALPDGAAWYAYQLRKATTTDLTPRQVHEIGLAEVRRIRAEMDKIVAATGFQGSFADFVHFLHTDPRFFYTKADDLLAGYRAIATQVDAKLPSVFGTVPSLPIRVVAIPANEAPAKSTVYYDPGSVAHSRPGTCFVNTFDLAARPKWEMTALSLHECMPGHHLQVTIAQTIRRMPKVLNYHDYTPFVEGWGVYAESLGDEMGLYRDPYVKFGQLEGELWRAMRVAVDTGIHSQGWTRQQAVEYFRANTAQDDRAIDVEINRYVYEPGLGTAYKIGELKLKELRAFAQKELAAAFDVRAFHDEVLRHGALPLDLVEANVRAWVAAQQTLTRPSSPSGAGKPASAELPGLPASLD